MGTHTNFEHVSIAKKANVYMDGNCVSYDLDFPGHTHKTLGVVLRSTVPFRADVAEVIEIVAGKCRVRFDAHGDWKEYHAGDRFHVLADGMLEMEAVEPTHYVCHMNS